jgi:hypothetical protein
MAMMSYEDATLGRQHQHVFSERFIEKLRCEDLGRCAEGDEFLVEEQREIKAGGNA